MSNDKDNENENENDKSNNVIDSNKSNFYRCEWGCMYCNPWLSK